MSISYFIYLLTLLNLKREESHRNRHIPLLPPLHDDMIYHINHIANTTWKAGHNARFRSMNDIHYSLGVIPNPNGFKLPVLVGQEPENKNLPKEFDARKQWPECTSIAEIRDQANCGSCWAFGAVGAMSDRICIASGGKLTPRLSAENLLACCSDCGMGCDGGFPAEAWNYWQSVGIVTGDLYGDHDTCEPYSLPPCEHHVNGSLPPCTGYSPTPACKRTCQSSYPKNYNEDLWKSALVYRLPPNEKAIMNELMTNGPMEVDFDVYADFPSYKSGVYQHVAGGYLAGHAVRLIGWGEENGTPYWLMANSWNSDWGAQGYFKILRGENECGIEEDVIGGKPQLPAS